MKRAVALISAGLLIVMSVFSVALAQVSSEGSATSTMQAVEAKADRIVSKMTEEEKVGQLMIIGLQGKEMQADTLAMLQKYHVGGVILFDRNMDNKAQVTKFTKQLQAAADLPLFICLDQEGGQVARMKTKLLQVPAAETIGQGKLINANQYAARCGKELKSIGINVNFAPVVDLGLNRGRSYSRDPEMVAKFAKSVCEGYESADIMFCLKHFPGIGKTKVDPHLDPFQIGASAAELRNEDLKPFQELINKFNDTKFFVMVSHLQYSAFDPEKPASLSTVIMQQLLRKELGFTGLIITDDLQMGALTKIYPMEELGYRAIAAGSDIALTCHEYANDILVYEGILSALQDGRLNRQRVDDSVKRVIKTKLLMGFM